MNFPALPDTIRIVFLDMDHTLINNDCDVSWKVFLAKEGIVGLLDRLRGYWHYQMYRRNRLNVPAFLDFQLAQFKAKTHREMQPLLHRHFENHVRDTVYPQVPELIALLKEQQRIPVLLTATNEAVAAPVASYLGIPHLIGTRLELIADCYTGSIIEPYCWGEGKIYYMQEFAAEKNLGLEHCSYWGDSTTDIIPMRACGFPVAVNPSGPLKKAAEENGWPVVGF